MRTLHGIGVHGFPNLMFVQPTQGANLISNVPHNIVDSARTIALTVRHALDLGFSTVEPSRQADRSRRSGSHPASEARAHHPRLDGAVRRPARCRRAPCSRSTRSRSTPSASSSPTSKASRSGPRSGGRSPTEINQGIRDAIARAAQGEFVRWDTPIYAQRRRLGDDHHRRLADAGEGRRRQGGVHLRAKGATSPRRRRRSGRSPQKNIELQGLLERIRELDEIKTQFFANVSHELRTPLALILGPAQRLIDDDGTMSLAQRRESGQVVARNARMLLKHVNDLLDMSKLEARKLKIELQDTDVAALVRVLASHFAVLAAERRHRLHGRRRRPRALRGRPGQAAARRDEPARQRLQVRARRRPRPLHACVSRRLSWPSSRRRLRPGRAAGAAPGDLRALPAGRRRHQPHGRRAPASGLAIAKEFVEMHQGRIEVLDSDLGGARFEVTLPLDRVGCRRRGRGRSGPGSHHARRHRRRAALRDAATARPTRAGAILRGPAARARRRRQPRHEPVRRPVSRPRTTTWSPRSTAARGWRRRCAAADGRGVRHHDAERQRRRDDRRDARASGAAVDADPAALGQGRRGAAGASCSTTARRTSSSSRFPSGSCSRG